MAAWFFCNCCHVEHIIPVLLIEPIVPTVHTQLPKGKGRAAIAAGWYMVKNMVRDRIRFSGVRVGIAKWLYSVSKVATFWWPSLRPLRLGEEKRQKKKDRNHRQKCNGLPCYIGRP